MILVGFFGLVASECWEMRTKEVEEVEEADETTLLLPKSINSINTSTSDAKKVRFRSRVLHYLI